MMDMTCPVVNSSSTVADFCTMQPTLPSWLWDRYAREQQRAAPRTRTDEYAIYDVLKDGRHIFKVVRFGKTMVLSRQGMTRARGGGGGGGGGGADTAALAFCQYQRSENTWPCSEAGIKSIAGAADAAGACATPAALYLAVVHDLLEEVHDLLEVVLGLACIVMMIRAIGTCHNMLRNSYILNFLPFLVNSDFESEPPGDTPRHDPMDGGVCSQESDEWSTPNVTATNHEHVAHSGRRRRGRAAPVRAGSSESGGPPRVPMYTGRLQNMPHDHVQRELERKTSVAPKAKKDKEV